MAEKLAECYLDAPRNLNIPTTPGRQLWFNGGKANIFDVRDITVALRRDDLTMYPSERYKDWWPDWLKACGEHQPARAKIEVNGVVHEPPYATLLVAQPPELPSPEDSEGAPQGTVLPAKRGPGRPKKIPVWAPAESGHGADSPSVDPDGIEAAGGSGALVPDLSGDDDDISRLFAQAVSPDSDAGQHLGLRDADG